MTTSYLESHQRGDNAQLKDFFVTTKGWGTRGEVSSKTRTFPYTSLNLPFKFDYTSDNLGRLVSEQFPAGLAAILASASVASGPPNGERWLSYRPAEVELEGRLSLVPARGPPGWGENPESGARGTVPILELWAPVNVRSHPADDFNIEHLDVRRVQIIGGDAAQIRELDRDCVTVRGHPFAAVTASHKTDVLIDMISISVAKCP